MSVACQYRWEMLFGETSPYGAFVADTYDEEAFDSALDWTDVSDDVRTNPAPTWTRGMHGGTPADRVAGVGVLTFSMNNFPKHAPARLGYYSPGHENQRVGFGLGIGCRLRALYKELDRVLFMGTVESVEVEPFTYHGRYVEVAVVDWMEEAATNQVENVDTLTNVRSDQAFTAIVQSLPRQPVAIETDIGMDTYAYAVDTARQEGATAQSEFAKLAMSELGYVYLKADGTLVFEGRQRRGAKSTVNLFTFQSTTFTDVKVTRSRTDLVNKVKVITHPRRVDASPVVLYRLVQPVQIGSGQTTRLFGGYTDPEQRGRRTGGFDFAPLTAGVDYIANSAGDGSGVDMTSAALVTVSTTGNGVSFTITNVGSQALWITTLQVRGRGIYDFEHAVMEAEDEDSILQFGRRTRTIDMPYQSDALVGASAARYLISLYADAISSAESMTYLANDSDAMMRQALLREISDRIGIRESVTGLEESIAGTTATRGWYINGVRGEIVSGKYLRKTYLLTPADRNAYWSLGVVGATELGITTRLGYGIFQGHVDVTHQDTHQDAPHLDTAHTDTHGDVVHADSAHADTSHSDSHSDTAHIDTAHADSHSDTAHTDVPHIDSHSDGAHTDSHSDGAHSDTHNDSHDDIAHVDTSDPLDDIAHQDAHSDSHSDVAHNDSHSDVAHNDSHNDGAHTDTAHADTHSDVSHADTLHSDAHTDAGHQDAAHDDVAHTDTHNDVSHVDTAHEDSHSDIGHGDTFG